MKERKSVRVNEVIEHIVLVFFLLWNAQIDLYPAIHVVSNDDGFGIFPEHGTCVSRLRSRTWLDAPAILQKFPVPQAEFYRFKLWTIEKQLERKNHRDTMLLICIPPERSVRWTLQPFFHILENAKIIKKKVYEKFHVIGPVPECEGRKSSGLRWNCVQIGCHAENVFAQIAN
jgi:hypothetical protein